MRDYCSLAEEADHIVLARSVSIQSMVPDSPTASATPALILLDASDLLMVAGIVVWKGAVFLPPAFLAKVLQGSGKRARQCSEATATAGDRERLLFIEDSCSGRRFLVDYSFQKSLLPPAGSNWLAEGCWLLLMAAKGTPIKTFGAWLVTVCFHDRDFQWNFVNIFTRKT